MRAPDKRKAAACAAAIGAVAVAVAVWHPWSAGTPDRGGRVADVSPVEALDEGAPLDDADDGAAGEPSGPASGEGTAPEEGASGDPAPEAGPAAPTAAEILSDASLRSSGSGLTVMADTDEDAPADEGEAVKARLAELQAACAAVEVGTEATDASRAVVSEYTYPDSSNAAKGVLLGDLFGGNATVDMGSVACKRDPDGDGWSLKVAFKLDTKDGQTVAVDGYYVPATRMFKVSNWAVAA